MGYLTQAMNDFNPFRSLLSHVDGGCMDNVICHSCHSCSQARLQRRLCFKHSGGVKEDENEWKHFGFSCIPFARRDLWSSHGPSFEINVVSEGKLNGVEFTAPFVIEYNKRSVLAEWQSQP